MNSIGDAPMNATIEALLEVKALVGNKVEMLPLPDTLPDHDRVTHTISVFEHCTDDGLTTHVVIGDPGIDMAESWGIYLAGVARLIARDYGDCLDTLRPDGDLFAALCDGFLESITKEK
jgi:hypothetical protein